MRFRIAASAFALIATAYDRTSSDLIIDSSDLITDPEKVMNRLSCNSWKMGIYMAMSAKEGWTVDIREGKAVYMDKDGQIINDWHSYDGYADSKCQEHETSDPATEKGFSDKDSDAISMDEQLMTLKDMQNESQ